MRVAAPCVRRCRAGRPPGQNPPPSRNRGHWPRDGSHDARPVPATSCRMGSAGWSESAASPRQGRRRPGATLGPRPAATPGRRLHRHACLGIARLASAWRCWPLALLFGGRAEGAPKAARRLPPPAACCTNGHQGQPEAYQQRPLHACRLPLGPAAPGRAARREQKGRRSASAAESGCHPRQEAPLSASAPPDGDETRRPMWRCRLASSLRRPRGQEDRSAPEAAANTARRCALRDRPLAVDSQRSTAPLLLRALYWARAIQSG